MDFDVGRDRFLDGFFQCSDNWSCQDGGRLGGRGDRDMAINVVDWVKIDILDWVTTLGVADQAMAITIVGGVAASDITNCADCVRDGWIANNSCAGDEMSRRPI